MDQNGVVVEPAPKCLQITRMTTLLVAAKRLHQVIVFVSATIDCKNLLGPLGFMLKKYTAINAGLSLDSKTAAGGRIIRLTGKCHRVEILVSDKPLAPAAKVLNGRMAALALNTGAFWVPPFTNS